MATRYFCAVGERPAGGGEEEGGVTGDPGGAGRTDEGDQREAGERARGPGRGRAGCAGGSARYAPTRISVSLNCATTDSGEAASGALKE